MSTSNSTSTSTVDTDIGDGDDSKKKKNRQQQDQAWLNREDWIDTMRAYKEELTAQGVEGWELMEAMTTKNLEHKIEMITSQSQNTTQNNNTRRCEKCWHNRSYCICGQLKELLLSSMRGNNGDKKQLEHELTFMQQGMKMPIKIKLCVLMHSKEYFCAGNSAKLLFSLLPEDYTELFLYGKTGEVERLYREINQASSTPSDDDRTQQRQRQQHTMILWPGKHSMTVQEFLSRVLDDVGKRNHTDASDFTTSSDCIDKNENCAITIRAIVLDGTYTQARNMLSSLTKRWGKEHMPDTVALSPTSSSLFHRAEKNYSKAHRQQGQEMDNSKQQHEPRDNCNKGHDNQNNSNHNNNNSSNTNNCSTEKWVQRVCTAEACGLLLTELGVPDIVQARILQAVIVNNQALAYARTSGCVEKM